MMRRYLFALLVTTLFVAAAPFPARSAEKLIGTSCSGDANAIDWDTIAQCNGSTFVKAGLSMGPLSDGSTATPALNFTNNTNMGLYRPGSNLLGLVTVGTERLRIDGSGNVGIGTTSPQSLLHLYQATSGIIPQLIIQNNHGNNGTDGSTIDFYDDGTYNSSTPSVRLSETRMDASNKKFQISTWQSQLWPVITVYGPGYPTEPYVGIGYPTYTTWPAAQLHVSVLGSASASTEALRLSNWVGGGAASNGFGVNESFYLESNNNVGGSPVQAGEIEVVLDNATDSTKSSSMRFYTIGPSAASGSNTATERMRINGSGNVGIGTTSPHTPLSFGQRLNSTNPTISVYDDGTYYYGMGAYQGTQVNLGFWTWNTATPRMVIDYQGNVGIGTTGPVTPLDVWGTSANPTTSGSTGNAGILRIHGSSTQNLVIGNSLNTGGYSQYSAWLQATDVGSGVSYPILLNPLGGNVGIGTTGPSYLLHVNGTAYATGAAGALSDIRHKKEVATLKAGTLEAVMKLRPVTYQWKEPKDDGMKGEQIGFIAQEVEKVLPSVVLTQNDKDQTKGLKYTEIIPVLTKALQEQQAEIIALRAEIAAMRSAPAH